MSRPKTALNAAHETQKRWRQTRVTGKLRHVKNSGIHGSKKRGSWCGIALSRMIPVTADVSRELRSKAITFAVVHFGIARISKMRAGPSN